MLNILKRNFAQYIKPLVYSGHFLLLYCGMRDVSIKPKCLNLLDSPGCPWSVSWPSQAAACGPGFALRWYSIQILHTHISGNVSHLRLPNFLCRLSCFNCLNRLLSVQWPSQVNHASINIARRSLPKLHMSATCCWVWLSCKIWYICKCVVLQCCNYVF